MLNQHLQEHHPRQHLDRQNFTMKVARQQRNSVERQAEEGAMILMEMAGTSNKIADKNMEGEEWERENRVGEKAGERQRG